MTRISWGRRPAYEPRFTRRHAFLIGVLAFVGLLSSVDGFVHRSIIGPDARGDIQALLDQHLRTLERGDDFQYLRTLDRQSAAHTRCMTEQFRRGAERVAELRPNRLIQLEEVSATSTLVRAYVQRRDGVAVEYIRRAQITNILTLPPFDIRRVTPIWYLSSPMDSELGGVSITQAGDATLESWDIDGPGRAVVERALGEISTELASPPNEAPGATPQPPLRVRLLPTPQHGPTGCVTGAVYDARATEISFYPYWADSERSALADRSREELREAFRQSDRSR